MDRNEQNIDKVWSLMEQIGIAMVVTHDGHGDELRARPMAAHVAQDDNAIYFLTEADAPKDREGQRQQQRLRDLRGQQGDQIRLRDRAGRRLRGSRHGQEALEHAGQGVLAEPR